MMENPGDFQLKPQAYVAVNVAPLWEGLGGNKIHLNTSWNCEK